MLEDAYANLESEAYQLLFDYIRWEVLENEKIVRLTEMKELLASYLTSLGVEEIKLLETTSVFIAPANMSPCISGSQR